MKKNIKEYVLYQGSKAWVISQEVKDSVEQQVINGNKIIILKLPKLTVTIQSWEIDRIVEAKKNY